MEALEKRSWIRIRSTARLELAMNEAKMGGAELALLLLTPLAIISMMSSEGSLSANNTGYTEFRDTGRGLVARVFFKNGRYRVLQGRVRWPDPKSTFPTWHDEIFHFKSEREAVKFANRFITEGMFIRGIYVSSRFRKAHLEGEND